MILIYIVRVKVVQIRQSGVIQFSHILVSPRIISHLHDDLSLSPLTVTNILHIIETSLIITLFNTRIMSR
jgi:hypothetical protein